MQDSSWSRIHWKAIYYDGRTARRHEVTVSLTSAGVYVTRADGQSLWWLFDQVKLAQGYHPGEPVRVETLAETPETVVVEDRRFLEAFLSFAPGRANLASQATRRLSSSAPLILASIAAAAFLLFALWRWGIPAFADLAARRIPASWEASLGQSVVQQLAPEDRRCTDPGGLARINEIIARLRPPAAAAYPITLAVVNHRMANAFAAPGGHVVVFRGLLEQTGNAEDLAGVLAHEIQHVEQRHALRGMVRQLSLASLLALLSGDSSSIGSVVDAAAFLSNMKYQREDEESADAAGVRMMQAALIEPGGLGRMLDRMSRGGHDEPAALEYFSSHPLTAARVGRLTGLIAQSTVEPKPLLEGYDWRKVAFMCGEPEPDAPGDSPRGAARHDEP